MGAIHSLRAALVADLGAVGVPVYPAWPKTFTPPCLFVVPPLVDQYVTPGPNFREYTVAVDVVVLVAPAAADDALVAVEDVIEPVLINSMDWRLRGVEPPAPLTVVDTGAEYFGAVIHLSKPIVLTS